MEYIACDIFGLETNYEVFSFLVDVNCNQNGIGVSDKMSSYFLLF